MKIELHCQTCDIIFTVSYKVKETPTYCVFCGDEIVVEENDDDEEDEIDEEE